MPLIQQVFDYLKASPSRLFWAFAGAHLLLWTLAPSIANQNLPLDVIEGYAWGKEWLIGTHKHPPLQAWILEILYTVTGRARWAPYLASQIAIVTAFWAVWRTGRRIAGEPAALVGVLLLEGIVYYNFTSPEFNPNVLQLPFWALAGWSFHKAIKDNRLVDWFLLGLWAAAGMYSKYSTGLLLLVLMATMFAHRDGRQRLTSIGPYLAVVTAVILFLPHLLWLIHNHFIPLQYAQGRFERQADHYSAAITTTMMVLGQIIALIFAFLLVVILYDRRRAPSCAPMASFDRIFLTFAAFGPFILMFCMSLIFGYHIRDMWETPFWNFIGLWFVVFLRPSLSPHDLRRFALAWTVIFAFGLIFYVADAYLAPYVFAKPKRVIFPGKRLSNFVTDSWHQRFHTPLNYVVGDTWVAGNIAWYADDRPHVLIDGETIISPWVDMKDFVKSGGVIAWCIYCGSNPAIRPEPENLQGTFPHAEIQTPITLPRLTGANLPPVIIGWAIVAPENTP